MEKHVMDIHDHDLKDHLDQNMDNLATSHKFFSKHTLLNYFPRYKLKPSGIIYIDERPPVIQCLFMGIQHVLAMFGSTVLGIL
jgi:hypothetical protein